MAALGKLVNVACRHCLVKGHHCQAQIVIDTVPLCMPCADGEVCYYAIAAQDTQRAYREQLQDPFEVVVPQFVMPMLSPREYAETLVGPPMVSTTELRSFLETARETGDLAVIGVVAMNGSLCLGSNAEPEKNRKTKPMPEPKPETDRKAMRGFLSIREVQRVVARRFHLQLEDLLGPRQTLDIVRPRHIAMYLAHMTTGESTVAIAAAFGKHHTTVLHGLREVAKRIARSEQYRRTIEELQTSLGIDFP